MKTISNLLKCLILTSIIYIFSINNVGATTTIENELPLNIYNVDLNSLDSFKVIEKGTSFDLILLNDLTTKENQNNQVINFSIPNDENLNLRASGFLSTQSPGKRFSNFSSIQLSTNKLYVDDGQEIFFSATSPIFNGVHPPHANSSSLALARTITNLSIATSPVTFGASLGASFLTNALLSAYKNGVSDLFWGGFNGIGLSFIERIFRKQPDLYLMSGASIPFKLKEDLKISNSIQKEKIESLNISKEDALNKIEKLLKWGDLSGALELSIKTGQREIYDELINKISL